MSVSNVFKRRLPPPSLQKCHLICTSKTWKAFPLAFSVLSAHSTIILSWQSVRAYSGKALERIVARRLAYIALKCKLFNLLHFGATPRRLAVDAVATLTHDIEKAFRDKKIMTVLTFDIKGAFDRVMEG